MPEREQTSAAKPFWSTLPTILTSAATLVGAITALYMAYKPTPKKVEIPKGGDGSNLVVSTSEARVGDSGSRSTTQAGDGSSLVISTFEARPASVKPGQPATLFWWVEHAEAIEITPDLGLVAASGSRQVQPKGPTTYVLTATSGAHHQRATVAITVGAPGLSEQVKERHAKSTALPGDEILGIRLSRTDHAAGIFQVTYRVNPQHLRTGDCFIGGEFVDRNGLPISGYRPGRATAANGSADVSVILRDKPAGVVFYFYHGSQGSFAPRFFPWTQDFRAQDLASVTPSLRGNYAIHVVRVGETLPAIAKRYRINLKALEELNGLDGENVRVGQELKVPQSSVPR
jgi:hypothetical protein